MAPGKTRLLWMSATIALSGFTAWMVTRTLPREHAHTHGEADFHQWMHDQLHLTDAQHRALQPIEHAYETEKHRLKQEIAAAGRDLAKAVGAGKSGAPEIEAAITRLNDAQGRLQRATLAHFFAMKEHLDPGQSAKLLQWTHDSILAD